MSLETLRADPRYMDARRRLNELPPADFRDPAMSRVVDRTEVIVAEMVELAREHGWDPEREEWSA